MKPRACEARRSRRQILRDVRAASIGALIATACDRAPEKARTGATAIDGIEPRLRLCWKDDAIDADFLAAFEREHGVAVTCDTYASDGELETMLSSREESYDLCSFGGGPASRWIAAGIFAPLDREKLPNFANLAPEFLAPPWDPGNRFTIPWCWGMTGIAYRTDKVEVPPNDLSVFFDPRYRRKMTMIADAREVLGAMLQRRGESRNCRDAAKLDLAKSDAIAAKKNLRAFVPSAPKAHLLAGEVWVAQLDRGEAARLHREDASIEWVLPKDGGKLWQESLAIPRHARHRAAAHAFIDFLLRPAMSLALAEMTSRGTTIRSGDHRSKVGVPSPTAEERARLEYDVDLGRDQALWDRVWAEVEAAN